MEAPSQTNFSTKSKNEKVSDHQFCKSCPVINKALSKTEDSISLPFAVDCGSDDICSSLLYISMESDLQNNRFILGSRNTFSVFVNILNKGEPAYQSEARIHIPELLILASVPPECSENTMDVYTVEKMIEVTCSVGNPIKHNVRFLHKKSILQHSNNNLISENIEIGISNKWTKM